MALAQVIHGTGEELIRYLESHRAQKNLTLIIPEEESTGKARTSYPEGATVRNGVPLFPTEGRTEIISMERVQQLMDED